MKSLCFLQMSVIQSKSSDTPHSIEVQGDPLPVMGSYSRVEYPPIAHSMPRQNATKGEDLVEPRAVRYYQ